MQITPNANYKSENNSLNKNRQSFTSRNPILRELSDISLLYQRELPSCSSTKLSRHVLLGGTFKLHGYLVDLIEQIRDFVNYDGLKEKGVVRLMDCMKRFKAGNCGEIADASYVACKLNGIENVKIMSLGKYNIKTKEVTPIRHAVLGINFSEKSEVATNGFNYPVHMNDKKGIIMDNWLKMVDYENNLTYQYKNDKFWGPSLKPDERFCYIDCQRFGELTDKDLLYLEETYPNLIKPKNKKVRTNAGLTAADKSEYDFQPMTRAEKEKLRLKANLKNAMTKDEISELKE